MQIIISGDDDSVIGLKSRADVKVTKDVKLYSAENGTYTFNNKAFTTDGDATVEFVMGASNKLADIWDFIGKISGDFSNAVTINNKTVNVTGDTAIRVVGAGGTEGISKITKLSGTADFLSAQYIDYNPSITGIKNLTSGTVAAYQDEKGLTVGNSIVTISGTEGAYPVSLGIINSTISGIDNLKGEISGLSGGATVNTADGEITINNSRLNITG